MSAEALPDFFAAVPAIVVADPLAALAGALRQLSPADRDRLAALLATGPE